ncbi:2-hydroxychromene-2-carboxylate isomerase [Pseudomonas cavernae]|uniref:2-hydroxychromene-2-carboxylate isomerase n=1 Tax=Pseudomonas cavernae TaxID=2320867 RepID=UPI0013C4C8A5|nr:2-hydroxychromene-2-carboxylate isomerase [Pseudomonas cavernae]
MIDFYFDFFSPYGYFAAMQIERLAERYQRPLEWHAMLLGISVVKVMGLKPLLETPLKGEYILHDVPRLAALYGIPFRMPSRRIDSLPPARAFCWVKQHWPGQAAAFAKHLYCAYFQEDRDIGNPAVLAELAGEQGLEGRELRAAIDSQTIKQALRDSVSAALERGVFGAPSFVVDGQLIWGSDRLWMLEHWLAHGAWPEPGVRQD